MEIEEVAESNPEDIIYENINPSVGLQSFQIRNLITKLEIPKESFEEFTHLIKRDEGMRPENQSKNCLGLYSVLIGQNLEPIPPAIIT